MKVRVYRNLNKRCLSVQHKTEKGWRLLKHTQSISLKDVRFIVSQSGRERCLREKRKNVHAFVEGELVEVVGIPTKERVTYNPYLHSQFSTWSGSKPVFNALYAYIVPTEILINTTG